MDFALCVILHTNNIPLNHDELLEFDNGAVVTQLHKYHRIWLTLPPL